MSQTIVLDSHATTTRPAPANGGIPGLATVLGWVERGYVPDALIRAGIRRLVASGLRERAKLTPDAQQAATQQLIEMLRASPIAVETDAANEQHYELPPEFFGLCLGPHRKYSGCYWPESVRDLAAAEAESLRITCEHAELADGQDILELGCGWGSLTLWMAQLYPHARITAVSNSRPQRAYILEQAAARGLTNVEVITADMNVFEAEQRFDRVVSVEMFEHMRNYETLMGRIAAWLKPAGKLFVHIFVHGRMPYLFEVEGPANWLGRYFFTGGIMPSDHTLAYFQRDLQLDAHWRQDGTHYEKTANAWLANMDRNRAQVREIFEETYGEDANIWFNRWRVFYLACAEMFGFDRGREWWVSHYRFVKPL